MNESYALLADIRMRELRTRLVLALLLLGSTLAIAPSGWPVVWFVVVVVTQLADRQVCAGVTPHLSRRRLAAWICSTFLATVAYTSIGAYLWTAGGDAGRIMAILVAAGGMLHVTIHMHHVRRLFLASSAPHAILFFGLPLSAAFSGQPAMWIVVLGAALFVAHLAVALRQASATTRQIQAERVRAERASKAKSDFLATISHEIRTPMNAIVSAANLLSRSRLDAAQKEQVEILTDANEVLLSLLNDVLDLSKIEAGKMTIERADVDVLRQLQGLQRLWQPRAADKGLDLRLEIDPDVPRVVVSDPLRLKQILFNLISNAVKFTATGAVTLRLSAGLRDGGEVLLFEVADTGAGISDDLLKRLFGAFEQGDAGTTRAHGGTGLGLAISRRLAALLGGALEVESSEGSGSTFRLILPLEHGSAEAAAPQAEEAEVGESGLQGLRVLVAEDHPVNQRVLELLLAPMGCRMSFADDGQKALELAAVQDFDVVLMDMQMPVLDGLEATRRLKAGSGTNADTPVIALTANALEHHRAAWAEVGVDAFVSKPIDPRELVAALGQAASRASARKAA